MCGIAGYFGGPDPAAPARVKRMLAAQRHRGPDGAGMALIWLTMCRAADDTGAGV
mgnify:CR=1 FL=1